MEDTASSYSSEDEHIQRAIRLSRQEHLQGLQDRDQEAYDLIAPLLGRHTAHPGLASVLLKISTSLDRQREAIAYATSALGSPGIWPEAAESLYFQLGKIPVSSSLKYFHEFDVKNRLEGDAGFLSFTMPLSVGR